MDNDEPIIPQPSIKTGKHQSVQWFKRIGIAGFLFFLIKGVIWLCVIYAIGRCN